MSKNIYQTKFDVHFVEETRHEVVYKFEMFVCYDFFTIVQQFLGHH
jgi:hypothetical protein